MVRLTREAKNKPAVRKSPEPSPKSDRYHKLDRLGQGTFGIAYLVERVPAGSSHERYVLKEIRCRDKEQVVDALREMVTMRILQCPWVVRYEEYWTEGLNVVLLMEYCPGGDLYREMNKALKDGTQLAEATVMKWFTQIALGLNEIHSRSFMHRDIKPSNVLLDAAGNAKLGDFGLTSNVAGDDLDASYRGTICGTPGFLSPELERGDTYNVKCDVWALACTLYEMLALRSVFQDTMDGSFPGPIPDMYSQEVTDLMRMMLIDDKSKRPHIEQILQVPIVARYARPLQGLPVEPTDKTQEVKLATPTNASLDEPFDIPVLLSQIKRGQFGGAFADLKAHPIIMAYLAMGVFITFKLLTII